MRILLSLLLSCKITVTLFLNFVMLLYCMYASVFLSQSNTSFPYHILTSLLHLCHGYIKQPNVSRVSPSKSLQKQRSWVQNWFSCSLTLFYHVRIFPLQTYNREWKSWWKNTQIFNSDISGILCFNLESLKLQWNANWPKTTFWKMSKRNLSMSCHFFLISPGKTCLIHLPHKYSCFW